ncbi:partial Multidrug resistance protein MdtK, partial [Anaerolineae bacterium]
MPAGARASTLRAELRELALLTVPLFLTHAGTMLLGLVDTAVVGRLGEVPLAAVGLGNSLYFTIAMLGFGLMLGLDPLIAQAIGAGEEGRARHLLWQGSLLAILVVIPLALVTWALSLALEPLGIEAAVAREVRPYELSRLAGM